MFMLPFMPETVTRAFKEAAAAGLRKTDPSAEENAIAILHGAVQRVRTASICQEAFAVVTTAAEGVAGDDSGPPNIGPAKIIELFTVAQRHAVAFLTEAGIKVQFLPFWSTADGRWTYQAVIPLDQF